MHVLQLCPRVPYPPHDGGAIAMYETVRGLTEAGHRVTVLAVNTPKHYQPATALDHLGPQVRLVTVEVDTRLSPGKALRNLLLSSEPYNVARFVSASFVEVLASLLTEEPVDILQFEGSFVAPYLELLHQRVAGKQLPPLVLRAHNIEHTIWQMLAARAGNPLKKWYLGNMAARLEQLERRELPRFDAVAAITEEDIARLRVLGCAGPIAFIPASFDLSRLAPIPAPAPAQPRTVFLIGSLNWLPNLEGVDWFLREIWPPAHAELPELELHIAGSHPPAHLTARPPGKDNVFVHGFVESAPAFMQRYELMLVPLLSGGGMRVKVVEGMALGKAILSTALGAEGIVARDGDNLLLRDSPAAWLAALRDYYHGRLPLAAIGAAAARTAHDEYDTRQVTQRLLVLYRQVLESRSTQ